MEDEQDIMRFRGRLCVPKKELKELILQEAHSSPFLYTLEGQRCLKIFKKDFGGVT